MTALKTSIRLTDAHQSLLMLHSPTEGGFAAKFGYILEGRDRAIVDASTRIDAIIPRSVFRAVSDLMPDAGRDAAADIARLRSLAVPGLRDLIKTDIAALALAWRIQQSRRGTL